MYITEDMEDWVREATRLEETNAFPSAMIRRELTRSYKIVVRQLRTKYPKMFPLSHYALALTGPVTDLPSIINAGDIVEVQDVTNVDADTNGPTLRPIDPKDVSYVSGGYAFEGRGIMVSGNAHTSMTLRIKYSGEVNDLVADEDTPHWLMNDAQDWLWMNCAKRLAYREGSANLTDEESEFRMQAFAAYGRSKKRLW